MRTIIFGLCFAFATPLLAQDPRTPISSVPFTISAQGSYYLVTNLVATGSTAGITIAADNVTLDLNGFALVGGGSGSVAGIQVPSAQKNIEIRNGTIRGWTNGGINAINATNSSIQKLRVSNNIANTSTSRVAGLLVGARSTVKDCIVANNTTNANQISALVPAIGTGDSCTVTGCNVSNNRLCDGISVGNACVVSGCLSRANFVGIRAQSSCQIANNVSDSNTGSGIVVGFSGSAQTSTRIESNSCTSNGGDGILIPSGSTNNLILRNSARANIPNYSIATGNRYGMIVDLTTGAPGPVFGNSAGSSLGTTDPWANFAY